MRNFFQYAEQLREQWKKLEEYATKDKMTAQRISELENKSRTTSSASDRALEKIVELIEKMNEERKSLTKQMEATMKVVEQLSKQMEKITTTDNEKLSKLMQKGFQSK